MHNMLLYLSDIRISKNMINVALRMCGHSSYHEKNEVKKKMVWQCLSIFRNSMTKYNVTCFKMCLVMIT